MKNEKIPWKFIQEAVQKVIDGEVERLDYASKLVEVKVYRTGAIVRVDIREVK